MTETGFVQEYLDALSAGDIDRILRLFTADAVVYSPLYGEMPAAEFYPALFNDTAESRLRLRTTMTGQHQGKPVVAFWFDFDWTLANGTPAPFSVVDIAELDMEGKIEVLRIVYDTAPIRAVFNEQHDPQ